MNLDDINFPDITAPNLRRDIPDIHLTEWDDGESPYELLHKNAHNSEKQRKILEKQIAPLREIAKASKVQANIALKKSKEADIKGWIAIILSSIALFFEFATNHSEIISFLKSLFNH